jgi:hypothetical protein
VAYRPGFGPDDFLNGTVPTSQGYRQGYSPEDFLSGSVGPSSESGPSMLGKAIHYGTLPFNLVWKGAQDVASLGVNAATRGDPFAGMRVPRGGSVLDDLLQSERAAQTPQVVETVGNALASAAAPAEARDPNTVSGLRELSPQVLKRYEQLNPKISGVEAGARAIGDLPLQVMSVPVPGAGTKVALDPTLGLLGELGRTASLGRALGSAQKVGLRAGEIPTAEAMAEMLPSATAGGRAKAAKLLSEAAKARAEASPLTASLLEHPGAARAAERAIGASFLPGMASTALTEIPAAYRNYKQEGLTPETIRQGVGGAVAGTFAALGAKHALKPGVAPLDRRAAVIEAAMAEAEKNPESLRLDPGYRPERSAMPVLPELQTEPQIAEPPRPLYETTTGEWPPTYQRPTVDIPQENTGVKINGIYGVRDASAVRARPAETLAFDEGGTLSREKPLEKNAIPLTPDTGLEFARYKVDSAKTAEDSLQQDWSKRLEKYFPQRAQIKKDPTGSYVVRLKDGSKIKVNPEASIEIPSRESVSARVQGEGEPIAATRALPGTVAIPSNIVMELAHGKPISNRVLAHDVFHAGRIALGISDKNFLKRFSDKVDDARVTLGEIGIDKPTEKQLADAVEEVAAEEYAGGHGTWSKAYKDIFGRVKQYWSKVSDSAFPTQKELFRKIETGDYADKPTAEWYRWLSGALSDYAKGAAESPSVRIANGEGPAQEPKFSKFKDKNSEEFKQYRKAIKDASALIRDRELARVPREQYEKEYLDSIRRAREVYNAASGEQMEPRIFERQLSQRYESGGEPKFKIPSTSGQTETASERKPEESNPFVAAHQLSSRALREADRRGGMPLPSLGITTPENPMSGSGIQLFADRRMVDPENGATAWAGDYFSARPKRSREIILNKEREKLRRQNPDMDEYELYRESSEKALSGIKNESMSAAEFGDEMLSRRGGKHPSEFGSEFPEGDKTPRTLDSARTLLHGPAKSVEELRSLYQWLGDSSIDFKKYGLDDGGTYHGLPEAALKWLRTPKSDRSPSLIEDAIVHSTDKGRIPIARQEAESFAEMFDRIESGEEATTPYFESKPMRTVKNDEWRGAILPKDRVEEAKWFLDKYSIPYETYESNYKDPGFTAQNKRAAIEALNERLVSSGEQGIKFKINPAEQPERSTQAPPRVERNVENLEDLTKESMSSDEITPEIQQQIDKLRVLDRDTPRTWASLEGRAGDIARQHTLADWTSKVLNGRPLTDVENIAIEKVIAGEKAHHNQLIADRAKAIQSGDAAALETADSQIFRHGIDLSVLKSLQLKDGTAAGRAFAARRYISKVTGDRIPSSLLSRIMKEIPNIGSGEAEVLEQIFHTNPEGFADAFRQASHPTVMDKVLEFWKAGLVSALPTHFANTMSNAAEQSVRIMETMTSAQIQKMLQGKDAPRSLREASAEWAGMRASFGPALKRFFDEAKDAFTLAPESIDLSSNKPIEYSTGAIPGKAGRAVRVPFRMLDAADKFFGEIARNREVHKLAYREALKEVGLKKGDVFPAYDRILDEIKTGDKKWADLRNKAYNSAQASIFRGAPDATLRAGMHLRKELPFGVGHIVVPFLQTPWNIAKLTWKRSPAYLINAYRAFREFKAGELDAETAAERMARPVVGTAITAFFYGLATQGFMTGSGPTDQKKRSLMLETGWQPYSFKVPTPEGGTMYLPYSRFEPVSGVLQFAADIAEAKDPQMAESLFDKATGSIVNGLVNKTFMKGLSDAAMVASRPMEVGGQYARNLAGSIVPNIVRKGTQAYDPVLRDIRPGQPGIKGMADSVVGAIESGIPGLSETLPGRITATGKPIERKSTKAGFLLPFKPTFSEPAPVERLLVEVGYIPTEPSRKMRVGAGASVNLTKDEYELLAEGRKAASDYVQKRLLNNREFNALPNTAEEASKGRPSKESVLKSIYSKFSDRAREAVWQKFPDLRKRGRDAIKEAKSRKHAIVREY